MTTLVRQLENVFSAEDQTHSQGPSSPIRVPPELHDQQSIAYVLLALASLPALILPLVSQFLPVYGSLVAVAVYFAALFSLVHFRYSDLLGLLERLQQRRDGV